MLRNATTITKRVAGDFVMKHPESLDHKRGLRKVLPVAEPTSMGSMRDQPCCTDAWGVYPPQRGNDASNVTISVCMLRIGTPLIVAGLKR